MYGIECYVSNHAPFAGKIKEKWEDFEVREVDLDGNIAQLREDTCILMNQEEPNGEREISVAVDKISEDACVTESPPEPVISTQQEGSGFHPADIKCKDGLAASQGPSRPREKEEITTRIKDESTCTTDSECKGDESTLKGMCNKEPHHVLLEYLDATILEQLESAKINNVHDCKMFNAGGSNYADISLGVVSEKAVRTKLHQCIRYEYPYLKTIVYKNGQGQTQMKVATDSAYSEFLSAGMTKDDLDNFFRFLHCRLINKGLPTCVLNAGESKDQRTAIHRLVRQHYGPLLESKTFYAKEGNSYSINVRFRNKRKLPVHPSDDSINAANLVYKFVLCKRNVETSDAITRLSRLLNAKASSFSFAGTKDKKAVTFQYVTTNEVYYADLDNFAKSSKGMHIEIARIEKGKNMLRLGELAGNAFKIVLREIKPLSGGNIQETIKMIEKAVSNVEKHGFINYFGTQRFGFDENPISSADIGLAMLKGDFVKAVDLLLSPTGLGDDIDNAKKYFQETRDMNGAAKIMPMWKSRELSILKALKQHGFSQYGCCQAILSLPYNVRLMYVHSYCSLVWNKVVTKRIEMFGLTVNEGDFVESPDMPMAVSASDVKANRYRVADIVLPLPGFRVQYPENLENYYESLLKEDGLERMNFKLKSLRLNVAGVYRKLISHPSNICCRLLPNNGSIPVLTVYPLRELESSKDLHTRKETFLGAESAMSVNLELNFSLGSSSYATVCLREIMRS